MPVVVSCQCGQRFSAQEQLYGKRVKCPACGGPLLVPAPAAAATAASPARQSTAARAQVATAPKKPAGPAQAAASQAAARPGVKVACACGQAFLALETMRGKTARCPACGKPISIPPADLVGGDLMSVDPMLMGNDPLSAAMSSPLADPLAANPLAAKSPQQAAAPAAANANKPPWLIIGVGGGAAAVVLVVVIVVVVSMSGRDVAQAPVAPGPLSTPGTLGGPAPPGPSPPSAPSASPASSPTPTNSSASPGASTSTGAGSPIPSAGGSTTPSISTTPGASTTPGGSTTPAAGTPSSAGSSSSQPSAFKDNTPVGGMGISYLPTGVHSWHNDQRFRRRGIIKVGDAETTYGHYSWMTQLLPFLGHQKEYDRINFNRGLFEGDNIQVGGTVIPAFLNPLDDRKTWKGYPLQGLALTHFVGMSGIEDTRNVVAGELPRSDPRAGIFGYDSVASPEEITDGMSQTIMVIGSGTMANPWIMGGGATVRGAREPYFDKVSGFGTRNLPQPGALTVMADGSVRFVSASIEPAVFRSMCTIHGRDTVDLEKAAAPFLLDSIAK